MTTLKRAVDNKRLWRLGPQLMAEEGGFLQRDCLELNRSICSRVCPPQLHASGRVVSLLHTATVLECGDEERGLKERPEAFTPPLLQLHLIRSLMVNVLVDEIKIMRERESRELLVLSYCVHAASHRLSETWLTLAPVTV